MKRIDFLKKLGIGLGVAVIAPSVVANNATTEEKLTPLEFKPKSLSTNIKTQQGYNESFMNVWEEYFNTSHDKWLKEYKRRAGINSIHPLYRRKDKTKDFEMSNGYCVGVVYYDKNGNKHIVYDT